LIEANFNRNRKGKILTYVQPGQTWKSKVDAYPGVTVERPPGVRVISPATGSKFSVIPAENATGNWV